MDVLKGNVKSLYFKYLFAASGSTLVSSIFSMVDAMMVGKYHGPLGNAALAVFNPLWSIIFSFGLLAGIGSSVLFANHRGRGDEENAQQYFTLSILYGIGLSAAAMLVIGLFQDSLFRFFGADDVLLAMAKQYLFSVFFAIPFCIFNNILAAYLRNDGNPALATKAVILGGIFNAFGDYFCVFYLDLGIFGAGLATAIGLCITTFIMLPHFFSRRSSLRLVRPTHALQKLGSITITGFSTAINDLAMGIIGILFNRQIMAHLGSDALAVYGVIIQVTVFAQCLAYGIGQGAQPIISQSFGAGIPSRIRECLRYSLYTCAGMGLFWTLVTSFAPNLFLHFFMTPTPSVMAIGPNILRIYGLSYLLLPFNLFATDYFQSIMKPNLSMFASFSRGIVVSAAMIMLVPAFFGADNLWYSMLITELLVASFSLVHMVRCTRALGCDFN